MKLEKRQKIILAFVAIAVLVLIWQLYSLFGGEVKSVNPSSGQQTVTLNALKEAASPTQVVKPVASTTTAESQQLTPVQQKYMAMVSQYQLVEIQRLIAQDQAAIATARAATADAMSKISQSGSDDSTVMANIVSDNNVGDYELIYTGQDNGQWTATLKKNGQFNDVTGGSVLPNGDKVLSVDNNGVLVQEGDVKKLITFNGSSQVNASSDTDTPSPQDSLQSQLQKPLSVKPQAKSPEKPVNVAILPSPVTTKPAPVTSAKAISKPVPAAMVAEAQKPVFLPKVVATNAPASIKTSTALDITKANDGTYTIQIVSDGSENRVKSFVARNHVSDKAQVLKVYRHGKPWFIAVAGNYSTMAQAQKCLHTLPASLQDEGPFVRRVGDIHDEMEK